MAEKEEKLTSIEWMQKLKDPLSQDSEPVNVDVKLAWGNNTSVKKGAVGERIVQHYLEKRGYVIYKCITDKPHAFDLMAIKDKEIMRIAEVKSKARMPSGETGINLSNYNEYVKILDKGGKQFDTFLFFVDEHPQEERIYGNFISALRTEIVVNNVKYPSIRTLQRDKKEVVFFHVSIMKDIRKLTQEEVAELKKYTKRKYNYE